MSSGRIAEIRLSEADMLCLWADYFVTAAIEEFGYEPDELPEGAADFTHLWKYHGECLNGGHAQYAGNTDGDVTAWVKALAALKRLGRRDYASILEEFIQFAIENEDRIHELYEEDEQAADALFRGFDERFNALEAQNGGLGDAIEAWLLQQDWLIVDPDLPAFSWGQLRQSIAPHPLLEQRRAERSRRFVAESQNVHQAVLQQLLEEFRRNAKS